MNISSPTQAHSTSNRGSSSTPSNPSLDQTFAQLLVAQLKSQDPLNPMDPTQFVSQLVGLNTLDAVTSIYQLLAGSAVSSESGSAAQGGH